MNKQKTPTKRMKITAEMLPKIYAVACDVYHKKITKKVGVSNLIDDLKLNEYSANIFIDDLEHMLKGKVYKRALSKSATNYYLSSIHRDFDNPAWQQALRSLQLHIDYREAPPLSQNQPGLREILNRMRGLLKNDYPDEIDPNEPFVKGPNKMLP